MAPFKMASRGRVLYEFVCPSGANLNDCTFEIVSNPLGSCLVNHWMTTNCLLCESCKKAMHFPKYTLFFYAPSSLSSSISTLTQSWATIPWYRGIKRYIKWYIKRYIKRYMKRYIKRYMKRYMKRYIKRYITRYIKTTLNRTFQHILEYTLKHT